MSTTVKRKLTTILCADVQSYTNLMEADERGTFDTLRRYRDAMAGLIARHDGRVVNTWGDAVIAEFSSVVEAVQCAIEVQRELAERNGHLPAGKRMWFRIGINLGDVMVENEDLYGEGVNIAARLQEIAEPGGIAISQSVHDQVRHKMSVDFSFMGDQSVKNVDELVPTYRVALDVVRVGERDEDGSLHRYVSEFRREGERLIDRVRRSRGYASLRAWWGRQPRWSRIAVAIIGVILLSNVLITIVPLLIGAGLLALLVYFWPQITRRNDPDGRHLTDKHNGAA